VASWPSRWIGRFASATARRDALIKAAESGDFDSLPALAESLAGKIAVQLTGHALLQAKGIELVPVDAPTISLTLRLRPSWSVRFWALLVNSRRR
jgi:hypothetical protein